MNLKYIYQMCALASLLQLTSGCLSFKVNNPFHSTEKMDVTLSFGRSLIDSHSRDRRSAPAVSLEFSTSQPSWMPKYDKEPSFIRAPMDNPACLLFQKTENPVWLDEFINGMNQKTL